MIRKLWPVAKAVFWLAPGFLLWASFPPIGEKLDVFVALAPLLWFARNRSPKESAKKFFVNGLLFWVATLSWMPAIVKNGGPWPLVVLGWGALSAYCAVYFAAFGWLSAKVWRWAKGADAGSYRPPRFLYARRLFALFFAEPVLWAGLELVRSRLFGGFAWNQLGVAPINAGLSAPAALGGVYAVSAAVVLVNGTLASIAERMVRRRGDAAGGPRQILRSVETFAPFAIVWAMFAAGGSVGRVVPDAPDLVGRFAPKPPNDGDGRRVEGNAPYHGDGRRVEGNAPYHGDERRVEGNAPYHGDERRVEGNAPYHGEERRVEGDAPYLRVALVQRNFPCVFQEAVENPWLVYRGIAERVAPFKADLAILPESAFCEFGEFGGAGARRFADAFALASGVGAVLGGGSRTDGGKLYNSAALFERGEWLVAQNAPGGGLRASRPTRERRVEGNAPYHTYQTYDKVHLVPFGEYIPGDDLFPALKRLAPVGSCSPGELKLLDFRGVKLGPAICFEDTDSAQVRRLAAMGAQVLVFITNDSWFSRSCEPVQHAWQAVARAVETGLPVVRAGNSGVTGIVTPDGEAAWLDDGKGRPLVDAQGEMYGVVRPAAASGGPRTAYAAVGDAPLAVAFLLLISAMCVVKYANHHEQRRKMPL